MPMDLLHRLSQTPLPTQAVEPQAIHQLHVLRAVRHVFASIPSPQSGIDGRRHQAPATVHQVTALGRKVLCCFGPAGQGVGCEKDHAF